MHAGLFISSTGFIQDFHFFIEMIKNTMLPMAARVIIKRMNIRKLRHFVQFINQLRYAITRVEAILKECLYHTCDHVCVSFSKFFSLTLSHILYNFSFLTLSLSSSHSHIHYHSKRDRLQLLSLLSSSLWLVLLLPL